MKTTIEINDALLADARRVAEQEGLTLRSLVESGLRAVLSGRERPARYRLPDRSVPGNGLQPEFQGASWEKIRDAIYEDRGA